MGVEAGMEGWEGCPGHGLEYFEMWRARTINAPDAHQSCESVEPRTGKDTKCWGTPGAQSHRHYVQ
jgi:hypothetical protein